MLKIKVVCLDETFIGTDASKNHCFDITNVEQIN